MKHISDVNSDALMVVDGSKDGSNSDFSKSHLQNFEQMF